MPVYKNTGEIDSLFYRTYTWDQGDEFGAQTCISRQESLANWDLGEAVAGDVQEAMHLSIWDAYKNYVKRYGRDETPRGGIGG